MPKQTYEHIRTTTLGSNTTTVDMTDISQAYTDLVLTIHCKSVTGSTAGQSLRLNNDSGSGNYFDFVFYLYGSYSTAGTTGSANNGATRTEAYAAWNAAANTDGMNMMSVIHLNSYTDTSKNKTVLTRAGSNAGGSGFNANELLVGSWNNTSAINRITLVNGDTYAAGSVFTLHGIKAG